MKYRVKEIAEITKGTYYGNPDAVIESFFYDSRQIINETNSIFIALKTNRNDGHNYIASLLDKGIKNFLISNKEVISDNWIETGVNFLLVNNTLEAIQQLAAFHRNKFKIPVIGITGSNGKTVVKEWLYQLLHKRFHICRSPKSFNSQIGVPLSVLNLDEKHQLAIFEAGISLPGEMERLNKIIRPDIGIFTSFGDAHSQGFIDDKQKLSEKIILFQACEKVIFNACGKEELLKYLPENYTTITENDSGAYQLSFKKQVEHTLIQLKNENKILDFEIGFTDRASILNASTCIVCLLEIGIEESYIKEFLPQLQNIALRLEVKNAINHSVLINDFYNADIDSVQIALSFLNNRHARKNKILIISDLQESGKEEKTLYTQLATLIENNRIDKVIGIGEALYRNQNLFKNGEMFLSLSLFMNEFQRLKKEFQNATILLKGSSSSNFIEISKKLQQKNHDTVLEIDLSKLRHNVNYYRSLTGPNVKLMCMVKAMGYGSGGAEIALALENMGANYLAVAYADEGVELRQANCRLPIMVMNPEIDSLEDIINYHLEPEIYSLRILDEFIKCINRQGINKAYPIHIKIDTGMKRLGFEAEEVPELINHLLVSPQVKIASIFSHLAASDNKALDDFTNKQINLFKEISEKMEKALNYKILKHICNTSGIARFTDAHFDMVRLGIGMYGIGSSEQEKNNLQYTGTLKTKISQIKHVSPKETVGYNRNGKVEKPSKIATIPIGYADGFQRLLGNGKHGVYIKGQYCKTIGNICMDMCMIDITDINCKEGDEVIIFENAEQVNKMAEALNTIPYEVLTAISGRVKRVYSEE